LATLVKDSGVEHISGVGASSIAREAGFYYSKLIVHHYEGQSDGVMWSAFGKAPHPLKELDLLPENTALAAYADVDVPLVWKTVEKELKQLHLPDVDKALAALPAQFKERMGISLDDVLGSLGGGYASFLHWIHPNKSPCPSPTARWKSPTRPWPFSSKSTIMRSTPALTKSRPASPWSPKRMRAE